MTGAMSAKPIGGSEREKKKKEEENEEKIQQDSPLGFNQGKLAAEPITVLLILWEE